MMLTADAVADIKAAQGVYRASDVAKAYNVHRSTVKRLWEGTRRAGVSPAPDFPDIQARPQAADLADSLKILMDRGMSIEEAAQELNISRTAAYQLKGVFIYEA